MGVGWSMAGAAAIARTEQGSGGAAREPQGSNKIGGEREENALAAVPARAVAAICQVCGLQPRVVAFPLERPLCRYFTCIGRKIADAT